MGTGLRAAVDKNWPAIEVQRCTVHKLRNLERHVPQHALEEVKSDYHRIIQAESLEQARKAYREFVLKWKELAPKVVVSLKRLGRAVDLLQFSQQPNGNRFARPMLLSGSTKFHIAKYLGEAVDKVRKKETRGLVKAQEDTLKRPKYLRLTNPNNWTEPQQALFDELQDKGLKIGRALSIKEMFCFQGSGNTATRRRRASFFKQWFWWVTHARLKPMAEVAKKLKRHLDNILTYVKYRITTD